MGISLSFSATFSAPTASPGSPGPWAPAWLQADSSRRTAFLWWRGSPVLLLGTLSLSLGTVATAEPRVPPDGEPSRGRSLGGFGAGDAWAGGVPRPCAEEEPAADEEEEDDDAAAVSLFGLCLGLLDYGGKNQNHHYFGQ